MPELPEVEVLVRHLEPLLRNQVIRGVEVRRPKVLNPTSLKVFAKILTGARFIHLSRRLRASSTPVGADYIGGALGDDGADVSPAAPYPTTQTHGGCSRAGQNQFHL